MRLFSKAFVWSALIALLSIWGLGCTDPDKGGGQGGHDHSTHQHDGGGLEAPQQGGDAQTH